MIKARSLRPSVGAKRRSVVLWSLRWRVMRRIAWQELRDALYSWPPYLTAAVGLVVAVLLTYNSLRFVAESGLQILPRPFYIPLLVTTSLAMLYVAAWATLAIVRPRDQGGLRVLFCAPIDAIGLIGGHMLAGLALYALLLCITTPLLGLLALLTNLPFPPMLLVGIVLSPIFVAAALGVGLCISSIAPSSRSAMFFFVAALFLLLALQIGYSALLSIPSSSRYYDALLFLRELLRVIRNALDWLSPGALLQQGLDAAMRASWQDMARTMFAAILGGGLWFMLAVWGIKHRGVLP